MKIALVLPVLFAFNSYAHADTQLSKAAADQFVTSANGKNLSCIGSGFCQDGDCGSDDNSVHIDDNDPNSWDIEKANLIVMGYDANGKEVAESSGLPASGYNVFVETKNGGKPTLYMIDDTTLCMVQTGR